METTRVKKELEILESVILKQLLHFEKVTGLLISDFTILKSDTMTIGNVLFHKITDVKIKVEI